MPAEGVELTPDRDILTDGEILRLVRVFAAQGVNKIRLTGGEPLIRRNLVPLCRSIANVEGIRELGITTNGIALKRKVDDLYAAGVTQFNISLDTLVDDKFVLITRKQGLSRVLEAIDACSEHSQRHGSAVVKVNCVVIGGINDSEAIDFAELTRDKLVDIRFIEYMPFGGNRWDV
eukprot:UN27949